jgi:hypothetical protein
VKYIAALCLALVASTAAFASGEWDYGRDRVIGSGFVRTENRNVAPFSAIEVEGSGNVTLSQGLMQSVTVETDDNALEIVKTEVVGGVLHLGLKRGVRIARLTRLEFRVTAPRIEGIVISGSGDVWGATPIMAGSLSLAIHGSGNIDATVQADTLRADIGGSGDIRLQGQTRNISISVNGSGNVRARDLVSASADVRINGSGSADITAREDILVNINGSGDVTYGGGARVTVRSSGSGTARER